MSKVPMTIDVDRYVCSELEEMRKMYKNRDFSGMMAAMERVQAHAQAMEDALYSNKYKEFFDSVINYGSYKKDTKDILVKRINKAKEKLNESDSN